MSVYTSLTRADLLEFLQPYDVGQLQAFDGIKEGIENTNYLLHTTTGKYVLTLFEQLPSEQVSYFLQLQQQLKQQGLPVAPPMSCQQGLLLQSLKGKSAALIQFQAGQSTYQPSSSQAFALGECLAQLHLASQQHPSSPKANRRDLKWMKQSFHHLSTRLDSEQRELIQSELDYQHQHWQKELPSGLIHGDLFRDNCLMLGDQVSAVLDWYAASHDHWLFDLAICINDWCSNDEGELQDELVTAMLNGYEAQRPLTSAEQQALNWALRRAALRFYLSRLLDMHNPIEGELTHIKDPDEFARLLQYFRDEAIAA